MKIAEDRKSLTIDTFDNAFLGQTVSVIASLSEFDSQRVGKAGHLEVEITFIDEASSQAASGTSDGEDTPDKNSSIKPLLFDMQDVIIPHVTCSEQDADWILKLPKLLDLSEEEDDV